MGRSSDSSRRSSALDLEVGAVAQHSFDHRRHLGRGATLELGVDAAGAPLDVPVDHHAAPAVADVPFGHQVAVPGAELGRVRRAGSADLAPDCRIARAERGGGHRSRRAAQCGCVDVAPARVKQLVVARVQRTGGDALEPGIGAEAVEAQEQPPIAHVARQRLTRG
jgi:hypothetical protein